MALSLGVDRWLRGGHIHGHRSLEESDRRYEGRATGSSNVPQFTADQADLKDSLGQIAGLAIFDRVMFSRSESGFARTGVYKIDSSQRGFDIGPGPIPANRRFFVGFLVRRMGGRMSQLGFVPSSSPAVMFRRQGSMVSKRM